MVVRPIRSVLLGMMLLAVVFGPIIMIVPDDASAAEYSGTSPAFATGKYWSLFVGYANQGDVIKWSWSSSDSLGFQLIITPDMTHLYGFSSYDGLVVSTPGFYNLVWYNNNWFFSATVSYWVAVFTPSTTITTPIEGAYLNSTTISIQGTSDPYSEDVQVGPDALHLIEASWSGNDWGVDNYLLQEGQNDILVRTYYWMDSYGYEEVTYDRTMHVTLDATLPDLAILSPPTTGTNYLQGQVNISWQCSDDSGIANREVKVDALAWTDVTSDSYAIELGDGHHVVSVRVTDLAGNAAFSQTTFVCDRVAPEVTVGGPGTDAKISEDNVNVWWYGSDDLSGIDHYEVRIAGGDWVDVGDATNHTFADLGDAWYSVDVKVVDKSGNEATATTSFGIYTSIWSQNGPYQGIPLFGLIAAIIVGAVVAVLLLRKRKGGPAAVSVPKEEPAPGTP